MTNKFSRERVKGFLHTDGMQIKNGEDEVIILRGWGAGNWMNPEGFMIGGCGLFDDRLSFDDFALPRRFERGRSMKSTVQELCGTDYAEKFEREYTRNYLQEGDIKLMAELGYNSLRLPVSARLFLKEEPGIHWIEEGFSVLDRVLAWCEKYRIYAILDLHGAPGGQSGLACDDGIDNRPHMFTEPQSRERTILLWEEFARRYADRWIIGGYDLINEPLSGPDCRQYIPMLGEFYDTLIAHIRKYDKRHMLTIEGAVFSRDMDIFDHNFDPECNNWCIHIHDYSFSPEIRELHRYLDSAVRCNVPIWIGEGGSDPVSNSVFYEIAAAFDIGHSIWSWKKANDPVFGERAGVLHPLPQRWEQIRSYITEGGPRPSYEDAQEIMDEFLENIKIEHCVIDSDYHHYNLRQPGIRIPAVGFDQGSAKGTGWRYGNVFGFRTEEGMKLTLKPGILPPPKVIVPTSEQIRASSPLTDLCLELREKESVSYTIRDVRDACRVGVVLRAIGTAESSLCVKCVSFKGEELKMVLSPTEKTNRVSTVTLSAGEYWKIELTQITGISQLDEIGFDDV